MNFTCSMQSVAFFVSQDKFLGPLNYLEVRVDHQFYVGVVISIEITSPGGQPLNQMVPENDTLVTIFSVYYPHSRNPITERQRMMVWGGPNHRNETKGI